MLLEFLVFLFLFFLIFYISKSVLKLYYGLVFHIIGNKRISVWVIALTFLPGTVLHELSHFLMASVLRVPTGHISIFPTIEKNGEVKAGHIVVATSDPFRLSLIGLSPMFVGLVVVYLIGVFLIGDWGWRTIIGIAALFQTTSSMFSSKRDLKSFVIVLPILLLLLLAGHLSGLSIEANQRFIDSVSSYLAKLNIYLSIAAAIDLLVYLCLSLGKKLQQNDVRQ